MAKVTNTSNQEVYVGTVKIAPHSVADVPDDQLESAMDNKMVESWFANGTLKKGEVDPNPEATNIHPNIDPKAGVTPATTGEVTKGTVGPGGVIHTQVDKEDKK